jgi:flagellar biosynthesis protein FliQ
MSGTILDLWRGCLVTVVMVGGPFVVAALAVGLLASVVQAATQLQENMISFVPKLIALGLVLAFAGHWALAELVHYAQETAAAIVRVGSE